MFNSSRHRFTNYFFLAAIVLVGLLSLHCFIFSPSAEAAGQKNNLQTAMQDFEALTRDNKKGMWRDSWEKLEKRFASIEKQGTAYAPEAFFYQARSREELAARSKNKNDWQAAIKLYTAFTSRYSSHTLADNACYNQAIILSGPLNDKKAALVALDKLIASYPAGDAYTDALAFRETLRSGGTVAPPKQGNPVPASSAQLNKQKELYNKAAAEWRKLLADKQRGEYRENWIKLEQAFEAALSEAPEGPEAHKALFQIARARQELAARSKLHADWKKAAELFSAMSSAYPASNLADDALFAQAEIMGAQLGDKSEARNILTDLLKRYPNGDMSTKAKKLLSQLPQNDPTAGTSPKASVPSASAAAQKISGYTGNHNTKAPNRGALLRHIEWNGDADSLVVTLELAGKAKYRRATLGADPAKRLPQRVRLDLIGTSPINGLRQSIALTGAPVAAINTSQQSGGLTRVEMDFSGARSYKVSVLQNPYRLQIEVHSSKVISGGEDLDRIKPLSSGTSSSNGNLVEHLGLSIKTIMIDAGHGGKDPGAVGNGIREANVTLDLAKRLGECLRKKGFTVMYTRTGNTFVALEDRTSLANSKKADIFVSIHVNSSTNKKLYGLETYYLDVARSDAARVVAARENAVNIGTASDLQFILSDLTRNTKKEESLALSKQVQKACVNKLGRNGFKVRDNGVRSAPFYVLMGARMPAFLIEVGYLSHNNDARLIKNSKYIQSVADGITDGIIAYQKELERLAR